MNRNEVSNVLAAIAAFDKRTVGEADVTAWFAVIGPLGYRQALDAVALHHRHSPDLIKPFHVIDTARRVANDHVERSNADPDYRADRDTARDDRLAEMLGGDRRVLGSLPRERGEPASDESRAATLAAIRTGSRSGRQSDATAVAALGSLDTLSSDDVLDAFPDWPRNRAAKALVHARCVEHGIEPPAPWTAERRRLRPTRGPGSRTARAEARANTTDHLEARDLTPIFGDNAA